jgi:aquaporin Z
MNRYVTEFIGTFFLVLTVGLTVLAGTPLAPLAIGAALMVMVYMGGHVSGAHYNPAVSLAVLLRGKLQARDIVPYMAMQILGAFAAAAVVYLVLGRTFAPAPGENAPALAALLVEVLYTTALCLVVLHSATAPQTTGNSFYGLAIGFTVTAAAFAGGPVSGGAFNPAVGIGPILMSALVGGGSAGDLWLYLVGPFIGGALAAAVYRVQQPSERTPQEALAVAAAAPQPIAR